LLEGMDLPLEDNFEDILGKAARGKQLGSKQLSELAGIGQAEVEALLGGSFEEHGARAVASVLDLEPERLVAIGNKEYLPAPVTLPGLAMFNTPFEDMTVNSYVVWDPESKEAAAFDSGSDCSEMLAFIDAEGLKVGKIFVTHNHGDHIYDIDRLIEKTGAGATGPEGEPVEGVEPFKPGAKFTIGKLEVETRLTWGHSRAGVTFVIAGLDRPVAIVGDAIFAGSMGGGAISYEDALKTNRQEILSLPDNTVVCPGHGPLTSIGEEKRHNPFFPETSA